MRFISDYLLVSLKVELVFVYYLLYCLGNVLESGDGGGNVLFLRKNFLY